MFNELDNEEKKIKGVVGDPVFANPRLPKGYLSVSQVSLYLKCGESYKRRYVDGEVTASNGYMVQGRGIHKAAETLHLSMLAGDPVSIEEMQAVYSDVYDKEIAEAVISKEEEEDIPIAQLKDIGVGMTTHYRKGALGLLANPDTCVPYPVIVPVAAERIFRVVLRPENAEPVPFLGVIDLEEIGTVVDLKTKKRPASQLDTDSSLQLTLYCYVTGKPECRLDQLVRPSKTKPTRYIRTTATRMRKETLHALDIVGEVAEDIAAGRFRKTNPENWWCGSTTCPYWSTCRGKNR